MTIAILIISSAIWLSVIVKFKVIRWISYFLCLFVVSQLYNIGDEFISLASLSYLMVNFIAVIVVAGPKGRIAIAVGSVAGWFLG